MHDKADFFMVSTYSANTKEISVLYLNEAFKGN